MRAFLRLLEASGAGAIPARAFDDALASDGPEVVRALVAAGVVKDAPRAETFPCDGVGCVRAVREVPHGRAGDMKLMAVCTRDPRECEMVPVHEVDLAQRSIDLDAFVRAVRAALRIAPPAARLTRSTRPSLASPILLGEQIVDGVAHDVFLARRADAPQLRALLAERTNVPRRTLVLVLTAHALDPDLAAQHATGRVQIDVLADRLTVRDGAIALVPRLRAVEQSIDTRVVSLAERTTPDEPRPLPGRTTKKRAPSLALAILADLPRATRWNEVTLFLVDDEGSLGIEIAHRQVRVTAAELGLGSKRLRRPTQPFRLLRTICEGNGNFVTRRFGSSANGKTLMSDLRAALCEAFGIAEDPFKPYSKHYKQWKPNFVALAETPVVARAMASDAKWLREDAKRDVEGRARARGAAKTTRPRRPARMGS